MLALKARMTKLVEDRIVFDVDKKAPSEKMLEDRIATLKSHKKDISRTQVLIGLLNYLFIALVFSCVLLVFVAVNLAENFGWAKGSVFFVLAEALCIGAFIRAYTFCDELEKIDSTLDTEAYFLNSMPSHNCESLMALFDQFPELQDYRNQVLQQGRKFTIGEYEMLHKTSEKLKEKKACNALYGIVTA